MTVSVIEWGNPPEPKQTALAAQYAAVVDDLKQRPGVWAKIAEGRTASQAVGIRNRIKPMGCEVSQRKTDTDTHDVYARWVEPF